MRVLPDRPTDPWRQRWQRAARIRDLGAMRISHGHRPRRPHPVRPALYAQRWRPYTGEPRAAVVIHHGLADHSDRYAGFAERLVHAGHAVWAFDMRGHGRSAGVRVHIDRVDDLLDDLAAFAARVRDREPGRPIVLHGHSLGELATALYAIERHPQVAGVVLAAPGIAFDAPPIQAGAIRRIAPLAPDAPALDVPHVQFSVAAGSSPRWTPIR